jgi:hypothetical protein
MTTYREQWKDPRWQKKRLEVMEAAGWECETCGDKGTTLNVHHKRYVKGRMVWEYEREELACLCEPCHETEHADRELLNRLAAEVGSDGLQKIIGISAGYLEGNLSIDPGLGRMAYEGREPYFELGLAAAVLEYGDVDSWRQVVRDFVTANPNCPPSFRCAVQYWDECEADFKRKREGDGKS